MSPTAITGRYNCHLKAQPLDYTFTASGVKIIGPSKTNL